MATTAKVVPLHRRRDEGLKREAWYHWNVRERGEAARPFRLWDAVRRRNYRWRNYADPKRAHLGALIEARWAAVGATIEVYDCRTGRLLGQYTRRVDSIQFQGE